MALITMEFAYCLFLRLRHSLAEDKAVPEKIKRVVDSNNQNKFKTSNDNHNKIKTPY